MIKTNLIGSAGNPGNYPYPRGYGNVKPWNNMIAISADNGSVGTGEIFLYGKTNPRFPPALFPFAVATSNSQVETYAVGISNDNILVSTLDNANTKYYLDRFSFSNISNPDFLYKSLYYEFPGRVRINYVKVYFQPLSATEKDVVSMDLDSGDISVPLGSINGTDDGAIASKRFSGKNNECTSVRIVLEKTSGAGIKYAKIVIDYTTLEGEVK